MGMQQGELERLRALVAKLKMENSVLKQAMERPSSISAAHLPVNKDVAVSERSSSDSSRIEAAYPTGTCMCSRFMPYLCTYGRCVFACCQLFNSQAEAEAGLLQRPSR